MAIFKGGKGRDDTFTGTAMRDRFVFDPAELTSGDHLSGGAGSDTLVFTAAGDVSADALANVRGIERIVLAPGTNGLVLTDALVASATGARVVVEGAAGNDRIDASLLTGPRAVTVAAGAGADTLLGGAGADVFSLAGGTLTSADIVTGGDGVDTIVFGDQTTVTAAMLANVRGVEVLELGDGGVGIAPTADMARSVAGLTILGGDGADLVDVSGLVVNGVQIGLAVRTGAGDDVIRNTAPAPDFVNIRPVVDGGAGADWIDLGRLRPLPGQLFDLVYDPDDLREVVARGRLMVTGAATVGLKRGKDQTLGDAGIVRGFVAVDASASTQAVTVTGGRDHAVIGGAGDDVLTGAYSMTGGKGADTIRSRGSALVSIGEGDFAAGESIVVHGGALSITGSADLTLGTVTGFETISLAGSTTARSTVVQMDVATLAGVWSVYTADDVLVRVLVKDEKAHGFFTTSNGVRWEYQGNDGANIIQAETGTLRGGGGGDTLGGGRELLGEGGDDRLLLGGAVERIDGGDGIDTLASTQATYFANVSIDLAARDQTPSDGLVTRGIENVDLSGSDNPGPATILGSTVANTLIGGTDVDRIDGRGGDDLIDGGRGGDRLTGGAGADTFRWLERIPAAAADVITDFRPGQDRLAFDTLDFDVTGAMDQRLVTAFAGVDIGGVDLLVYTGGRIDESDDVVDLLEQTRGGSADQGLFVLARDSAGASVLYHSAAASGAAFWDVAQVADLGTVPLHALSLSDIVLI